MKYQMKNKIKLTGLTSMVLALGLASTGVAWAAGTHAHSHDHGQKETASVIGKPGKASQVKRSISIDMTDNMRFTPSRIDVKKGETVRFLVKNSGQLKHELVLGTPEELAAFLSRHAPQLEDELGKIWDVEGDPTAGFGALREEYQRPSKKPKKKQKR